MNGLDEERMGYERLDVWTRGWMQAADTESGRGGRSLRTHLQTKKVRYVRYNYPFHTQRGKVSNT